MFSYEIKPLCYSVQIYQYSPGIDVIASIIAVKELLCDSRCMIVIKIVYEDV